MLRHVSEHLLGVPRESRGIKATQRRTSVVQDWGSSFMGRF